jgi:hypothetical protein
MNWVNWIPNWNVTLLATNKFVRDVAINGNNNSLVWGLVQNDIINKKKEVDMNLISQPERQPALYQSRRSAALIKQESRSFVDSFFPYFLTVSEQALSGLMARTKTVTYLKNGLIGQVMPHSPENSVCMIFSGKVSVVNGEFTAAFHVKDNEAFVSEIAVLPSQLLGPAATVSFESTVLAMLAKSDVINWLKEYPDVTFTLKMRT